MSGQSTGILARLRQPVELHRGGRTAHRGPRATMGASPQVSLLPTEVREAGAVAAHRRRLVAVVIGAAIVAAGAVALAQRVEEADQQRLAVANKQALMLNGQLAKFDDVRALETQIAVGKAGVKVGSSTLIDWRQQVDRIEASMPAGYRVTGVAANGATPLALYPQGSNLLEPRRAATIVLTVTSTSAGDEFSSWLGKIRDNPAYADASANVSYDTSKSIYTIDLTVHLTGKAISAKRWTER